jgi:hypothetical protein
MGKMDRLLMFHASYYILHHARHPMAHTWSSTIDPVEPVVEELTEPAIAEESANTELTEGKPRCIPPIFLDFCFKSVFCVTIVFALSLQELYWHHRCIRNSFPITLAIIVAGR